jgi:hypothetical protein
VVVFGIASAISEDISDLHVSQEAAEATLARILRDEPTFTGELWVEEVHLGETSPN